MRYINCQKKLRGAGGCCGWIAVTNTLKWLGYSISYKRLTEGVSSKLLNTGLENHEVEKLMKLWRVKSKRVKAPTVRDIERELDNGNAVLLNYYWIDDDNKKENYERAHACFIHGHDKDNLFIENILHVPTKKTMRDFFKTSKNRNYEPNLMYVISR
jgi:hypothetical protein